MSEARAARALDAQQRYFREFLPAIRGQLLLPDLSDLDACFEIHVTDGDEPPWRLVIAGGRLLHVAHDGPQPGCRYALDTATLLEVVSARCTPAAAFFDVRIELDGDMELGLRLSTVLEPFFRRFPFAG